MEESDKKTKMLRATTLTNQAWKGYDFDDKFKAWDGNDPLGVHTTSEMLQCLERRDDIELDAKVYGYDPKENLWASRKISKHQFKESFKHDAWKNVKFREFDSFGGGGNFSGSGLVGNDFTPLLGGPFFKNLYYYNDYIRMHCLTGDSLISTPCGGLHRLDDLVTLYPDGKPFEIIAFDIQKRAFVVATAHHPRKTISNQKLCKVVLKGQYSETFIKCTVDHKILTIEGYKEAQDLKANDQVIALSNYLVSEIIPIDSEDVYDLTTDIYHNFIANGVVVHNSESFYAYHHDPFARAIAQITRDFVLGTGYELQCDTSDVQGKLAMAAWKAFEDANDFQEQTDQFVIESCVYGESMFYELPNNQSKIVYDLGKGDKPPVGIIPRVRIIDPSNIVEIITYPEDITRPLTYIWLTPTQYQSFGGWSGGIGNDVPPQPTLKFIYRQIPADLMQHYKINSVSNEKRGRSDFFPVLSYLKRLRDSVDYALITLQKVSAYSLDTEIDGDQTDIDAYVQAQQMLGTIPAAGSEFVHDTKVKRQYMGNQHSSAHTSDAFQWAFSCIGAGTGIPVSYFGTHLSGGTTKASALVATEPVAKKMEKRRKVVSRMLNNMWKLVMKRAGLPNVDCAVIFPEIITQDRSAKLKDILLCEQARWIKPERAAQMAAKEIGIEDYNYQDELKNMSVQLSEVPMPLTGPAAIDSPISDPTQGSQAGSEPGTAGLTGTEKKGFKDNDRTI